ncbi:hypothetical protein XELAEV_18003861mg [Xenopus laevis]|nr:hypothetical protein XELAEV_18003861mg [Xenopus laevis]
MVAAMQPMLHQQCLQELWMRRWMAQIHTDIWETRMTIHRGFQDLMAAQPHRPGGSAEGEVPGPPAAPPPPPEAPQHRRELGIEGDTVLSEGTKTSLAPVCVIFQLTLASLPIFSW